MNEIVKNVVNTNYKIASFWSFIRFIIFLILGIILVPISIFFLLFSPLIGLIVFAISLLFFFLSWINKKAYSFNKISGKNAEEKLDNINQQIPTN